MEDLLQLSDVSVVDVTKDNEHTYHIDAVVNIELKQCSNCSSDQLIKNGNKLTLYRDRPIHGLLVGIYLKRRRYKCKQCHSTLYQSSFEMHEKALMTKRLYQHIYEASFNQTFQSVANEVGVNEKTVRRIFSEAIKPNLDRYKPLTPIILGIDEAHLIGSPRCVITNVKEHCLVDMLPNRNKVTLTHYISNLTDKHKISVVSIDMWRPYLMVIKELLPQAIVVIDKFHVVKLAQEALEKARKAIKSQLSDKERKQLKNDRYLLLKRQRDLSELNKMILFDWFAKFPELEHVYILKESFFCIFDLTDKQQAITAYDNWLTLIDDNVREYFEPVAKTIENWKEHIFNYFDYQYTNSCTGAIDSLTKVMNKNGRGYSFEVLRAKSVLSLNSRKYKKTRKSKLFNRSGSALPDENLAPPIYYGQNISTLYAEYQSLK